MTSDDITGNDPATRHPLPRITHVADLVAAVPTLLGFYPQDSVVVIFLKARKVTVTLRADLVDADRVDDLVRSVITDPIRTVPHHDAVAIVVVSPTRRPDVAAAVEAAATCHGVTVLTTIGVAAIEAGARWECLTTCRCRDDDGYDGSCGGELPDPASTPAAVQAVIERGLVTAASRDELWRRLAPTDPATLERRARLLDTTITTDTGDHAGGAAEAEDERIVALGMALTDERVRETALQRCLDDPDRAHEKLLIELTRGLPGRWAANPAAILAVSALLRGDGACAAVALDRALGADPTHRLARLMQHAVAEGITPAQLRDVFAWNPL